MTGITTYSSVTRGLAATFCTSVLINDVALHRARLLLGWVSVYEQVNHLGMYLDQLSLLSLRGR